MTKRSRTYEIGIVLLLSLNFGILFFDRNATNFLSPFFRGDLKMDDADVGMLSSGLSLTWALAGFTVGRLSDKFKSRKPIIVGATLLFCVCSVISGLAQSFLMLLGARIMMGAVEGGVMPVSHSVIAAEIDSEERGLAMGVAQNLGSNVLGSFVAPVVLMWLAVHYGWRPAFYLAALPGIISAALLWFFLKEPASDEWPHADQPAVGMREAFAHRNIQICALVSILLVSYLVCCWSFMPLYLSKNLHFSMETTSWLMAVLGISAGIGSFAVSSLSDHIGRRLSIIVFSFAGVILPLGAMYWHGSAWVLGVIFFFGWALNGVFPIFMATIPSESVDPRLTASLSGVVMGVGEAIGGVFSPSFAGTLSDMYGREAVLWFMLGLCVLAGILGFGLRETAPRVLARRRAG